MAKGIIYKMTDSLRGPSTISASFVKGALNGVREYDKISQERLDRIMTECGLNAHVLKSEKGRVDSSVFAKLIDSLWNELDDEFLSLGKAVSKRGSFATMCQLAIGADTLRQALVRCSRIQLLFDSKPKLCLEEDGSGDLKLLLNGGYENSLEHAFLSEALLPVYHRFSSWLIGTAVILKEVCFSYPRPAYSDEYNVLFNCPINFDADYTGFVIDASSSQKEVVKSNLELRAFFESSPKVIFAAPQHDESFSGKIRIQLNDSQGNKLPTFEEVAEHFMITPQTLRRRLKDEGTTYKQLKENYRRDLSIYLLTKQSMAIKDISERLGFTETSAFQRAFKDWTGITPAEYRTK